MSEKYYYSPSLNTFCIESLRKSYESGCGWPDDAKLVSEEVALEFMSDAPLGKIRVANKEGNPEWGDVSGPTDEQLVMIATNQKQALIKNAADKIAPLQDALDIGIATDKEINKLTEWKEYRVLLSRIDVKSPCHILWPSIPSDE